MIYGHQGFLNENFSTKTSKMASRPVGICLNTKYKGQRGIVEM